jgi:hypothetical protein
MGSSTGQRVQSSLNLILPIKSWLEFKESSAVIHFQEGQMTEARNAIDAVHFARFVELRDHNHLGYFTVFDGDFRTYFTDLINDIGPIFDALLKHVVDGPPVPCESETFLDWSAAHNQEGIGFYSAFPALSIKAIRELTETHPGDVDRVGAQSALTLVLPVKSPTHFAVLSRSLTQFLPQLNSALDTISTVYFFRIVPWGTHAMVLVAEHDFSLERLAHDLSKHLGPMFDEIFENVIDGPPTPVQEHTRAFTDWIIAHNLKTWGLYSAYPVLYLENIRALNRL